MCGDGSATNLATCTAIGAELGTGCHFIGSGPTSTCVSPTACSDGDATNTATCAAIGTGLGSGCHLVGTGSTSTCVAGNVFGVSRLFAHDWFPCLDVTSKIARVPPYADTLRRLICSHCVRRRQRHHLGHLHCNWRCSRLRLPLHRLRPNQHLCGRCVSLLDYSVLKTYDGNCLCVQKSKKPPFQCSQIPWRRLSVATATPQALAPARQSAQHWAPAATSSAQGLPAHASQVPLGCLLCFQKRGCHALNVSNVAALPR